MKKIKKSEKKTKGKDMEKVKIKRVKRKHKKTTTQEKILAGLGVGSTLVGGVGAISPKSQATQFQRAQTAEAGTKTSKVKQTLKRIFGVGEAKAAEVNKTEILNRLSELNKRDPTQAEKDEAKALSQIYYSQVYNNAPGVIKAAEQRVAESSGSEDNYTATSFAGSTEVKNTSGAVNYTVNHIGGAIYITMPDGTSRNFQTQAELDAFIKAPGAASSALVSAASNASQNYAAVSAGTYQAPVLAPVVKAGDKKTENNINYTYNGTQWQADAGQERTNAAGLKEVYANNQWVLKDGQEKYEGGKYQVVRNGVFVDGGQVMSLDLGSVVITAKEDGGTKWAEGTVAAFGRLAVLDGKIYDTNGQDITALFSDAVVGQIVAKFGNPQTVPPKPADGYEYTLAGNVWKLNDGQNKIVDGVLQETSGGEWRVKAGEERISGGFTEIYQNGSWSLKDGQRKIDGGTTYMSQNGQWIAQVQGAIDLNNLPPNFGLNSPIAVALGISSTGPVLVEGNVPANTLLVGDAVYKFNNGSYQKQTIEQIAQGAPGIVFGDRYYELVNGQYELKASGEALRNVLGVGAGVAGGVVVGTAVFSSVWVPAGSGILSAQGAFVTTTTVGYMSPFGTLGFVGAKLGSIGAQLGLAAGSKLAVIAGGAVVGAAVVGATEFIKWLGWSRHEWAERDTKKIEDAYPYFNEILQKYYSITPSSPEEARALHDAAEQAIQDGFNQIKFEHDSSRQDQQRWLQANYFNNFDENLSKWSQSFEDTYANLEVYEFTSGVRMVSLAEWGQIRVSADGKLLSWENQNNTPPPQALVNAIANRQVTIKVDTPPPPAATPVGVNLNNLKVVEITQNGSTWREGVVAGLGKVAVLGQSLYDENGQEITNLSAAVKQSIIQAFADNSRLVEALPTSGLPPGPVIPPPVVVSDIPPANSGVKDSLGTFLSGGGLISFATQNQISPMPWDSLTEAQRVELRQYFANNPSRVPANVPANSTVAYMLSLGDGSTGPTTKTGSDGRQYKFISGAWVKQDIPPGPGPVVVKATEVPGNTRGLTAHSFGVDSDGDYTVTIGSTTIKIGKTQADFNNYYQRNQTTSFGAAALNAYNNFTDLTLKLNPPAALPPVGRSAVPPAGAASITVTTESNQQYTFTNNGQGKVTIRVGSQAPLENKTREEILSLLNGLNRTGLSADEKAMAAALNHVYYNFAKLSQGEVSNLGTAQYQVYTDQLGNRAAYFGEIKDKNGTFGAKVYFDKANNKLIRLNQDGTTSDITSDPSINSYTLAQLLQILSASASNDRVDLKTSPAGHSILGEIKLGPLDIGTAAPLVRPAGVSDQNWNAFLTLKLSYDVILTDTGGGGKMVKFPSGAGVSLDALADYLKAPGALQGLLGLTAAQLGAAAFNFNPAIVVLAPIASSMTPAFGVRGNAVTVTISGQNLTGAQLSFPAASGIVISGLQVNAAGTQLTAVFTINAAASTGDQTLTLATANGTVTKVFTVNTTAAQATVSSLVLSRTAVSLAANAVDSSVTATVNLSDATVSRNVTLTSSDSAKATATVDASGVITIRGGPSAGTAIITVHPSALPASDTSKDQTITVTVTAAAAAVVDPAIALLQQQIAAQQAQMTQLIAQLGNNNSGGNALLTQRIADLDAQNRQLLAQLNQKAAQTFGRVEGAVDYSNFKGLQMPAGYQDQTANTPPIQSQGTYKVKKGDTLSSIAKKVYGDSSQWRRLLSANPKSLAKPGNVKTLKIGFELVVPK